MNSCFLLKLILLAYVDVPYWYMNTFNIQFQVLGFRVAHTGYFVAIPRALHLAFKIISGIASDRIKCLSEKTKMRLFNTIALKVIFLQHIFLAETILITAVYNTHFSFFATKFYIIETFLVCLFTGIRRTKKVDDNEHLKLQFKSLVLQNFRFLT